MRAIRIAMAVLLLLATPSWAAWVSIVNLDTYQGGVPTELDMAPLQLRAGETARIGVLIELMDGINIDTGESNPNQMATAIIFFDGDGLLDSTELVSTHARAINDYGEPWCTEGYSTGMEAWIADPMHEPAPALEGYHGIFADDPPGCAVEGVPGGGNHAYGNAIFLVNEIEFEAVDGLNGQFELLIYDALLRTEFFSYVDDFDDPLEMFYGRRLSDSQGHGGSNSALAGYWIPRNGTANNPYRITISMADGTCCVGGACLLRDEDECVAMGGLYADGVFACGAGDCNSNGTPDVCDVLSGQADDVQGDYVPDECQCFSDAACDDGYYCNGEEHCVGGACLAGSPPCGVTQFCLASETMCVNCLDNSDCDDGVFCNGREICENYECVSPGDPCAEGGLDCDEQANACACGANADCDDGVFCNGEEQCHNGACLPGEPPCIAEGLVCVESEQSCTSCTSDAQCDNGLYCDGVEACLGGVCEPGFSPCGGTTPNCDEALDDCLACVVSANCDDGLFCNGREICVQGECRQLDPPCIDEGFQCNEQLNQCVCNSDDDCDDGVFCNGAESCTDGACLSPGNPCVADGLACSEAERTCYQCLTDAECNDAFYCNGREQCVAGFCEAGDAPCDGLCNDILDACVECLVNTDCNDGQFCNGEEECRDGECRVPFVPCGGGVCLEEADQCADCLVDSDCDNHAFCDGIERCVNRACEPGEPPCGEGPCSEFLDECVECRTSSDCDDGIACTVDICDGAFCAYVPTLDCDDGEAPAPPPPVEPIDPDVIDVDVDGDTVPDLNDNCPQTQNPGQRDEDSDGVGDACDACPGTHRFVEIDGAGCSVGQGAADGSRSAAGDGVAESNAFRAEGGDTNGRSASAPAPCGGMGMLPLLISGLLLAGLRLRGRMAC